MSRRARVRWQCWLVGVIVVDAALLACGVGRVFVLAEEGPPVVLNPPPPLNADAPPRKIATGEHLTLWWEKQPDGLARTSMVAGEQSNIHPGDYIGPDACKDCHERNYASWSTHPHRWMNARADATTVKGDFSGQASVSTRGGVATFFHQGDGYFMRLERGSVQRLYRITQTIGARFFQYYVGLQIEGPEPRDHSFYRREHVLPFGYWLDEQEWGPTVHIGREVADDRRPDPFEPRDHGEYYAEYAVSCNTCHTTLPLGDLFGRRVDQMGAHAPAGLHWSIGPYMAELHPETLPALTRFVAGDRKSDPLERWDAAEHGITLGISCEACHLGAREHVESQGKVMPKFFPNSPWLGVEKTSAVATGRTHDNANWACGRCHTGPRPRFVAGMSTWNSVEYADAMRGSCYSQLTCITCHEPHKPIGKQWARSADADDAICLKCHESLQPAAQRLAHTHHAAGSDGGRCMNCHMPRINEGLQDVVRTHMIYSPTRADMIHANQPSACSLCHTDRPIDWTLGYLKTWYGKTYDEALLARNYPDRSQPVALGWLESPNASVRLVAADAVARARDRRALARLLDALDDSHLINRQFAVRPVEKWLGVRLGDFGYRYYQTETERRPALTALKSRFVAAD